MEFLIKGEASAQFGQLVRFARLLLPFADIMQDIRYINTCLKVIDTKCLSFAENHELRSTASAMLRKLVNG